MALFRRILCGVLAAGLLVLPAAASGSCCCTATPAEPVVTVNDGAAPSMSAGCPHCRAAAKSQSDGESSDLLHLNCCGCSQNSQTIPATLTNKRDTKSEVSVRHTWRPVEAGHLPDARRIVASQVANQTGNVPLNLLHSRWLA